MGPTGNSEREWLESVVVRMERALVAYALRLFGGNLECAKDCVQDTFLSLCKTGRSAVDGHVEAWLFKTCRNRAMDWHRREARMMVDSELPAIVSAKSTTVEPIAKILQDDERERLRQQMDRLPLQEQEVLALRLGQGLSYKQIAEIMDLNVSHVGVLLHQAVSRLRSRLAGADPGSQLKNLVS